jgi:peptide/nickel transport system substrate-binding protein
MRHTEPGVFGRLRRSRVAPLLVFALVVIAACAPSTAPRDSTTGVESRPADVQSTRTLNIIMRVEPTTALAGSVDRNAIHKPLFTATLGGWDLQEQPYPILAEAIPSLNTDAWKLLPDGRMETTYRLRSGLTWHDGTPLTAEDVAFSRRAALARVEYGIEQTDAELRAIEDIVAPDARTVVIRWREPYWAAAAPDLIPFPRHLLEGPLDQGEAEAFGSLPYWSTGWIGAGPYRIDRWERGAFIEGAAFDGFALGRPKISRVRLTWNNDPTVSLTRLLAGDADIALDGAIRFEQAAILRQQWNTQNGDTILLNPTSLRYIQVQARPAYASPRALLDVRARRAILHAIDRPALAETMLEDRSMVADTIPPPTAPYYAAVNQVTAKYPYDPRRAEQLLGELGYTKGGDGILTSQADGPFRMEVRGVSGGQEEQDTTIVTDYIRAVGIDAQILLLPSSSRAVDDKMKGTFPGLTLNNNTLQRGLGLNKWLTSNVGGPDDNWVGGNRMGWSNPEFDRIYNLWSTTLDRTESTNYLVQMMRIFSDELPSPPLYFNFQVVAHTGALRGPQPITPDSTRYGNVHEWSWR